MLSYNLNKLYNFLSKVEVKGKTKGKTAMAKSKQGKHITYGGCPTCQKDWIRITCLNETNHRLHAAITFFTFGLWAWKWRQIYRENDVWSCEKCGSIKIFRPKIIPETERKIRKINLWSAVVFFLFSSSLTYYILTHDLRREAAIKTTFLSKLFLSQEEEDLSPPPPLKPPSTEKKEEEFVLSPEEQYYHERERMEIPDSERKNRTKKLAQEILDLINEDEDAEDLAVLTEELSAEELSAEELSSEEKKENSETSEKLEKSLSEKEKNSSIVKPIDSQNTTAKKETILDQKATPQENFPPKKLSSKEKQLALFEQEINITFFKSTSLLDALETILRKTGIQHRIDYTLKYSFQLDKKIFPPLAFRRTKVSKILDVICRHFKLSYFLTKEGLYFHQTPPPRVIEVIQKFHKENSQDMNLVSKRFFLYSIDFLRSTCKKEQ